MVDLITATRAIVLPAVEAVFREREVTAVELRESGGSTWFESMEGRFWSFDRAA